MTNFKDIKLLRQQAFIGGEWTAARSGRVLEVLDPASGQHLGNVPACDENDTRSAIEAAERALPNWSAMTAHARAALLRKWHDLMLEHADDLARIMTLEQGKPLAEARRRDPLRRRSGVVRRGGQACLRRDHPGTQRSGACSSEASRRRLRRDHAVELPHRDDHPQVGPALAAGCTIVGKPRS